MKCRQEQGSTMVLTLLVTTLLLLLGSAMVTTAISENSISRNDEWQEGTFYATEAGLEAGIDQLGAVPTISTAAIPVTALSKMYAYRTGRREDTEPQPFLYNGSEKSAGYTAAVGTGYNPSGYIFQNYQINVTGTGPRNAEREIETQVAVGPIPE